MLINILPNSLNLLIQHRLHLLNLLLKRLLRLCRLLPGLLRHPLLLLIHLILPLLLGAVWRARLPRLLVVAGPLLVVVARALSSFGSRICSLDCLRQLLLHFIYSFDKVLYLFLIDLGFQPLHDIRQLRLRIQSIENIYFECWQLIVNPIIEHLDQALDPIHRLFILIPINFLLNKLLHLILFKPLFDLLTDIIAQKPNIPGHPLLYLLL